MEWAAALAGSVSVEGCPAAGDRTSAGNFQPAIPPCHAEVAKAKLVVIAVDRRRRFLVD
jgi:hypothetical protein